MLLVENNNSGNLGHQSYLIDYDNINVEKYDILHPEMYEGVMNLAQYAYDLENAIEDLRCDNNMLWMYYTCCVMLSFFVLFLLSK